MCGELMKLTPVLIKAYLSLRTALNVIRKSLDKLKLLEFTIIRRTQRKESDFTGLGEESVKCFSKNVNDTK